MRFTHDAIVAGVTRKVSAVYLRDQPRRGTKFEDRHALMGAVMRPALRRDLRYADVFDAELFVQQGTRLVKSVVLPASRPRALMLSAAQARAYTMA